MNDSFLRLQAATQHFSLGVPRSFALSRDGNQLFFVRSQAGDDPRGCIWKVDLTVEHPTEELLVDPTKLIDDDNLPEAERRRRERAREAAGGVVAFSMDDAGERVAFALNGDIYVANGTEVKLLVSGQSAYDPRISPDGSYVAFVADDSLKLIATTEGASMQTLASDTKPEVSWGLADFVAAEEMGRTRGFWWAPNSQQIIAESVDVSTVQSWYIGQPAHPEAEPQLVRYPAAGTPNAQVGLAVIDLQGTHTAVAWDVQQYEYLVDVVWEHEAPLIVVQTRDQKTVVTLRINPHTGKTTEVHRQTDATWVELGSTPLETHDGAVVQMVDEVGERRICKDTKALTPPELIIRAVHGFTDDERVIYSAHQGNSKAWHIWEQALTAEKPRRVTQTTDGIHGALVRGKTLVLRSQTMESPAATSKILRLEENNWHHLLTIENKALQPPLKPRVSFHRSQTRHLETALVLPEGYADDTPLPILLDPYGGPGAQRVLAAQAAYLDAQWWANQGFAVVITDNRGAPGRGPAWEKEVAGDLIGPVLEDQIEALHSLAASDTRLDLTKVGIKGWSFGGYLAAYAVVRHPDVFHAAVAGAPVTEWRLYDTHYTERYLGNPKDNGVAYDGCSLLKEAGKLSRPLMLIHGLADDNVVVAHSLQLSSALLAAGRPHQVLPLSGVTHMASQAVVAENIEKLQLAFFQQNL